jgi:hypothetical protein
MLLVRQQKAGRRKEHRPVNYMAALMVANHEAFLGPKATRAEALSSKPGIGDKARSALQELRTRLTVDAGDGPATPALLDYPYRS